MKQAICGCSSLLFLCLAAEAAQAQQSLAGTAWQGTVHAPTATEVVLQFKRDTLLMIDVASREVMEVMLYTQQKQQWTWKKIVGGSPCDNETPGTYAYQLAKDQMTINVVNDPCTGRALAIKDQRFQKVTWPAPKKK